jgi:hypothetical protein
MGNRRNKFQPVADDRNGRERGPDEIARFAEELKRKGERAREQRADNRHRLRVERQRAGYE